MKNRFRPVAFIIGMIISLVIIFFIFKRDELRMSEIEMYISNFEKYAAEDVTKSAETGDAALVGNEETAKVWEKQYFLLMIEFMAGGFTTSQNLDYLNPSYPNEYYEYCIEDIDADGTPEFLLSYKYNGKEQTYWEIYSVDGYPDDCYVGNVMYIDRERSILFDGYDEYSINAYTYKDNELADSFSYEIEYSDTPDDTGIDKINSDDETESSTHYIFRDDKDNKTELSENEYKKTISRFFEGDIKFHGKKLSYSNLIKDLHIDISDDDFMKICADRAFYGILRYFLRNDSEMRNYRYEFLEVNADSIPEMIAVKNSNINLYFYRDGIIDTLSGEAPHDGAGNECLFYPQKMIFKTYNTSYGNIAENYHVIRSVGVHSILLIEKEPIIGNISNDYKKDIWGRIRYRYYINGTPVTKQDCQLTEELLEERLGLDSPISLTDIDFKSIDEMKTLLESETRIDS